MKIIRHINIISLILLVGLVHTGCNNKDDKTPATPDPQSSWEVIQSKIFESNCNAYHTAGTSFARQSDLVFTTDIAYSQLIDRSPKNAAALADGLELVGTKGLESLYNSFYGKKSILS